MNQYWVIYNKVDFAQLLHPLLLLFALFSRKNDNIILNIFWYSIFMEKNIKNGWTVQKNFSRYRICAESYPTIRHFILGHFRQKLMTQFSAKVQKPYFWALFSLHLEKCWNILSIIMVAHIYGTCGGFLTWLLLPLAVANTHQRDTPNFCARILLPKWPIPFIRTSVQGPPMWGGNNTQRSWID